MSSEIQTFRSQRVFSWRFATARNASDGSKYGFFPCTRRFPKGQYFVRVTSKNGSPIRAYTLSFRYGASETGFEMGSMDVTGTPISGDCFQILNDKLTFPGGGGVCIGMACYSKWYYENRTDGGRPLIAAFSREVQISIANQAQADIGKRYGPVGMQYKFNNKTDYRVAEDMIQMLSADGRPVILLLGQDHFANLWIFSDLINYFNRGSDHAVLVTGYTENQSGGLFRIYNNWYNDHDSQLPYANQQLSNFSDKLPTLTFHEFENVDRDFESNLLEAFGSAPYP